MRRASSVQIALSEHTISASPSHCFSGPARTTCAFGLLLATALILGALQPPALAQQQGGGVVDGRLVNGTDRALATGPVDIDVVGLGGGMSVLKSIKSDAAGRFHIEGLPAASPMMIRAEYKSVYYHSRVQFDAAGKANVELEVFEPTTSMKDIVAQDVRLAYQLTGDSLRSLESYTFNNQSRPPRSFTGSPGSFRFSKSEGLLQPPDLRVTGPGASMPLIQNALESADGKSYYSDFPLRPGATIFEVDQSFPYSNRSYTLRKTFYTDVASFQIGVIPRDITLEGDGLRRVRDDAQANFAVFEGGPVTAGTELVWKFSGGTPVAAPAPQQQQTGGSQIRPMPNAVGRNAAVIGPFLLLGLVVVLWYAYSHQTRLASAGPDPRVKELRDRKEQLLNQLASLEHRQEKGTIARRDYVRAREQGRRQLRRIAMLLRK